MNVNCNIDISLRIGRYVLEASFWSADWKLFAETHMSSAIKVLQVGPFVFSLTNLKKMKELHESNPEPISFDELVDL